MGILAHINLPKGQNNLIVLVLPQIRKGTPGHCIYSTGCQRADKSEQGSEDGEEGFPKHPGSSSLERALPHHGKGSY